MSGVEPSWAILGEKISLPTHGGRWTNSCVLRFTRNEKDHDTELDELCVTQPVDWEGAFENLRNALRDTYLTISVTFCQICPTPGCRLPGGNCPEIMWYDCSTRSRLVLF